MLLGIGVTTEWHTDPCSRWLMPLKPSAVCAATRMPRVRLMAAATSSVPMQGKLQTVRRVLTTATPTGQYPLRFWG